jgi:hypothetical protein
MHHRKAAPVPPEPTESEIQHEAYLLWIEEGRPEGRDQEHWFAARELLRHRHGRTVHSRHHAPAAVAN